MISFILGKIKGTGKELLDDASRKFKPLTDRVTVETADTADKG
jgi:hypothetical protein